MRLIRFAALPTAIGVALLLAACSDTTASTASTEADRYAIADQLESQISELSGVVLARVVTDSPRDSWANVAVRLDYDASPADKHATLVRISEMLHAEPAFEDYLLQAAFDSPHDLPLGSTFVAPHLVSVEQLTEETQLWLTITATVPAVGIVQFSDDGLGATGIEILPAMRPDGTVPSEEEVEAMIADVTDLPYDYFVDTEDPLATQ